MRGPSRWRIAGLAALVALAHLWLASEVMPLRLGDGSADHAPRAIEVAFVNELAPTAPPTPPGRPPRPSKRRAPPPAAPAASAAASAGTAPEASPVGEEAGAPVAAASAASAAAAAVAAAAAAASAAEGPASAAASVPLPDAAASAPAPATAAAAAAAASAAQAASAPDATAFDWPPSTRLSYRLVGNYRGPVEGQARVEWRRSGLRYQVEVEISIGPSFAPLLSRRATSEGTITPQGLAPQRYDEVTRALLSESRQTIFFDADRIRLPDGRELPRPPGVQDSASQFVQLTWIFTTQPQWLEPGRTIVLPLALRNKVEPWTYDVLEAETLDTPAGAVPTVHVKPRRDLRPGGDLAAEIWVAPSLQYLPVKIVIRQDADTYIDLTVVRLPQQAERGK